ncbi:hypothetical protein PARC_p0013 (plasmid) [Pseudoalteromonas arctica A 37-1-2]|uniref:Uncharacterized protein n=1 Tax=Pseudoalteromonas arctica A 37-1-2 TaxID=1117313 RepID=A0A290SAA1_9GAMM|nr:hypothetical protein PARC_p0013 [Pseudoalteromonas arctica A 37-1-2]
MGGLKLPLWKIGQVTARILAMQPRSMGNRSSLLLVFKRYSSALWEIGQVYCPYLGDTARHYGK